MKLFNLFSMILGFIIVLGMFYLFHTPIMGFLEYFTGVNGTMKVFLEIAYIAVALIAAVFTPIALGIADDKAVV